jgi:hypothetical protein
LTSSLYHHGAKKLTSSKYFHGDHPPHHFLRFSKFSLEKALNFSGFKDIEVYKLDFPFAELFPYLEKSFLETWTSLK